MAQGLERMRNTLKPIDNLMFRTCRSVREDPLRNRLSQHASPPNAPVAEKGFKNSSGFVEGIMNGSISDKKRGGRSQAIRLLAASIFFIVLLFPALTAASPTSRDRGTDTVVHIVDGDTLTIQHNGRAEKIRLIGIDAPESSINNKTKKDAARGNGDIDTITKMGKEATHFVRKIVKPGDPIIIEFDKQTRDKYGRLLGYVYLSNGRMLNEEIVKAGYANLLTYPPNVKYQDRFLKAYREARENSRGLWAKY
jgi:micrococcal nuclease